MTSSSLVGSRNLANHTAQPENDLERKMTATSGRKCLESYVKFSRHGLWAKTFSALLIGQEGWYSKRCRLTWKLKGTKSNRMYFQLQVSAHRTEGIGFGLLPTVTARDEKNGAKVTDGRIQRKIKQGYTVELNDHATMGMLPTPVSSDATTGAIIGKNDTFKETAGLPRKINQNGTDGSVGLARLVQLLPTPTTRDANGIEHSPSQKNKSRLAPDIGTMFQETHGTTSQLNPLFVAEMMGFPTDWTVLPFLNGDKSQSKPTAMP